MLGNPGSNPARSRRLALAVLSLLGAGPLLQARGDPGRFLTLIETTSDASHRTQDMLREYARALRRGTTPPEVTVLQEVGWRERFVLVERAEDAEALTALEQRAQPALRLLGTSLAAPLDRRAYRDLGLGCRNGSPAPGMTLVSPAPPGSPEPLYVVAHLDIAGPMHAGPQQALARLAGAVCRSAGNLRFEVWQQANRANHFDLIAVWKRRSDFEAFAASGAARAFRESVGPWLGSPYDERLYRALAVE